MILLARRTLATTAALVTFLAIAAASNSLLATELILREQANAAGPVLLLGDIANVHSSDADMVARLTSTPLGPAPQGNRFLHVGEVRDLLLARGMDLSQIRIRGATVVAIGRTPTAAAATRKITAADRRQLAAAIEEAIGQYLSDQTGSADWNVELISRGALLDALHGAGTLEVADGLPPWTGRQQFSLRGPDPGSSISVAVRVQRVSTVVYATTPIEAGQLVRASQLELRPYAGTPPSTALASIAAAAGQQARRAIRPDTILSTSSLRAPLLVRRGETVSVYARTGGVTVRTFATAKQDGALGDLIQVESTASRQRYAARVSGRRELEVYATGVGVDDYTLPGPQTAGR